MNAPDNEIEVTSAMPAWYDPFVEPQTIPAGWDLSELFHSEQPQR